MSTDSEATSTAGHRPKLCAHGWKLRAAAIATVAGLAAGCGSSSGPKSQSTAAATRPADAGTTAHVVMEDLEFNPTVIQARVGQTVVWKNEDTSPHNVTYVSGPRIRSSRPMLSPGARFSVKLTAPGTIHYYCSIHPWMKATIVVSR